MNKFLNVLYLVFLILAESSSANAPPTAVVQIDKAVRLEMAQTQRATGTVTSQFSIAISAEIEGNIEEILDIGVAVKKDQMVAQIEPDIYQLQYEQSVSEQQSIAAQWQFYQREVKRLQQLDKTESIAKNQLAEMTMQRDQASSNLKASQAKSAQAKWQLNHTIIRAPFSGIIGERYRNIGEYVQKGTAITQLFNTDTLEVHAYVQGIALQFLKPKTQVQITGPNNKSITGYVRSISTASLDNSRLYELNVSLKDFIQWSIGTAVSVHYPISEKRSVIAVPQDAIVIRQSGFMVYRVNQKNTVDLIPVQLGMQNRTYVEVLHGIEEGDVIVTRGNERLRPNQAVKIISQ